MPSEVSGRRKLTLSRARVTSDTQARPKPPPITVPSTTVTMGRLEREKARHSRPKAALTASIGLRSLTACPALSAACCCASFMRAWAMSPMSPPAQKWPPAPRSTTTRACGLLSASVRAESSSCTMVMDIALRTSGRFSVRVQTPWSIRT